MQNGLYIGTVIDKTSLDPLVEAITKIMNQPGDQETIRHALNVLQSTAKVENLTISHCHIRGDRNITINDENDVEEEPSYSTGARVDE